MNPRVLGPAGAVVLCASVGAALASARAPAAPASPAGVDFVRDVQPILSVSCVRCHGPRKTEGDLRLDTRAGLLKGGDSGAAVVPRDGKASFLYQKLVVDDPETRMPRRRPPLTPAQIETVRSWIDQGAPWPEGTVVQAASPPPDAVADDEARDDAAGAVTGAVHGLSFNKDV